jgi:hypothetical protein
MPYGRPTPCQWRIIKIPRLRQAALHRWPPPCLKTECTSTTSGPLPRTMFTSTIFCRWSKAANAAGSKSSAPSFTPWILSSVALTRQTAPIVKSPPRSRTCSRVMAPGPQPNFSSAGSWTLSARRSSCHLTVWHLQEILTDLPRILKRVTIRKWQQVLSELHFMSLGIPGARGLFSTLHHALRFPETRRIGLTVSVHDFLDHFRHLALTLSQRPTRISEVMPQHPGAIGACDAAASGMGGVHFVPTHDGVIPLLWRAKFDASVTARLVTFCSRKGDILAHRIPSCATSPPACFMAAPTTSSKIPRNSRTHKLQTNSTQTSQHKTTTVPTLHRLAVENHHPCTTNHYVPTLQHSLAPRHHVPSGSRRRRYSLVKYFNPHPLLYIPPICEQIC